MEKTVYEICHAGIVNNVEYEEALKSDFYKVTVGHYQQLLARMFENLIEATKHASNNTEKDIFKEYVWPSTRKAPGM